MEEVHLRFSHITEQIFEKLDNNGLSKCRKVSIVWQDIVDDQKEIWMRKRRDFIMSGYEYRRTGSKSKGKR